MTSDVFFEFLTKDDWKRIYAASPFQEILILVDELEVKYSSGKDYYILDLRNHTYELRQRLSNVIKSYVHLLFYYEKGIPDERWFISPAKDGKSIEYFPDFEEHHHYIKNWFDFYSDVFYYMLFSCWDTLGHILNLRYDLNVKKPSFAKVICPLEYKNESLCMKLREVLDSKSYKNAKKIRNDITHNYLPNVVGMAVFKPKNHPLGITHVFGLRNYITSNEIVSNVREALDAFTDTIGCMLE